MKSPKEKAEEIVKKHYNIIHKKYDNYLDAKLSRKDGFFKSKEHALISIDYLIEETTNNYYEHIEIKKEIEKL